MKLWKKILLTLVTLILIVVGLFLLFIGPWPVYRDSEYEQSDYYAQALEDIKSHAATNDLTADPDRLQAGWASRDITPPVGTPLAGYGGRPNGKISEGVRDNLEVTALALHDGQDTLVLVGADMLITPPNLAEAVRAAVADQTGGAVSADDILFNASHTHCGVGAFGPGLISQFSAGEYNPAIVESLTTQFTEAIVEAYNDRSPAAVASGMLDLPQYIRNRTRDAAVDPILNYLVAKKDGGEMVYLMRYSAHPTIFSSDMMLISAEYPGELKRYVERMTRHEAHYLGGAVGSMGPRAPEGADASARVTAMGEALGKLVVDAAQPDTLEFRDHLDVAAIGIPLGMPQLQLRPVNTKWRISPLAQYLVGLPQGGWIHGGRVGDLVFMGLPCDFSGEISNEWRAWAEVEGYELWTLSFSGTYCGYFSPDRYYNEEPLGYETKEMSWYGPNIEAYFTDLFKTMVNAMAPPAAA
jgi:hypothetical protein